MKKFLTVLVSFLILFSVSVYADNRESSITILTKEVDKGEKVYLKFDDNNYSDCDLTLTLKNQDGGEDLTAIVESVSSNPYFVMPTTVKEGTTFKLTVFKSVNRILGDVNLDGERTKEDLILLQESLADWENIFTTEEQLRRADVNLDGTIAMSDLTNLQQYLAGWENPPILINYDNTAKENTVKIKNNENVIYYNDLITENEINEIKSTTAKVITVIVENDKVVDLEVFKAIKDTDKTLIIKYGQVEYEFNGKDIKNLVDFNVEIKFYKVSDDEEISKLTDNGLVIDLTNNRTLPSEFTLRVNNSILKENGIEADEVNIKSFSSKELEDYLSNLKIDDDKYEFSINKPIKYVMFKIDKSDKVSVEDTGANKNNVKVIVAFIFLVLVITFYVYSLIYKSHKNNNI